MSRKNQLKSPHGPPAKLLTPAEQTWREDMIREIAAGVAVATGETFFASLVEQLTKTLGFEYAFIGEVVDPEQARVSILAVHGHGQAMERFEYDLLHTPCDRVIRQQIYVYPDKIQQHFPKALLLQELRVQSYVGMPLLDSRDQVLGILGILSCRPLESPELTEEVLKIFAARASSELERTQTQKVLELRARQQAAVAELGQYALAEHHLEALMHKAVSTLAQTLQMEYCKILELLPNQGLLQLRAGIGWGPELVVGQSTLSATEPSSQASYTLLQSDPVLVEDLTTDPRFSGPPLLQHYGVISGMSILIPGRHQPFGILGIHATQRRVFSQDDVNFLKAIANILAHAIERNQTKKTLLEQATLLDIATDAILVSDLNNTLIFWNKAAERIYGWRADEVLGHKVTDFLKGEAAQLADAWRTVMATGEWRGEIQNYTKAQDKVMIESHWTLVRDEAGEPISIFEVATDITQKKNLEAQVLRSQRLDSVGTLASGIAHDLNNILTPILGAAQILAHKHADIDAQDQQLLGVLQSSATRAADLTQQILAFARGTQGELHELKIDQLILRETQKIIVETFPKTIELDTQIAGPLWSVKADATQLHQVLMNLSINARDAMPHGGRLTLKAENKTLDNAFVRGHLDSKAGPYVMITVADTGTGMTPGQIDKIFDPFFTTKEPGRGTGLGLSSVTTIIKSHGGFIQVSSELGEGSTFQVFLPAIEATTSTALSSEALPQGQGERLLIVDDEIRICETTQITLETYGYQVLVAHSGASAIAQYAQYQAEIKAVLVDMMMPIMDGATLIQTLRHLNPQLKIMATSGLISGDPIDPDPTHQVQAFLPKPYTAETLLKTVRQVLDA
ncbi:MAG: GAF domain-containing protein [Cyanobacteria bacterium J06635_1]